jgi:hypothetical protein
MDAKAADAFLIRRRVTGDQTHQSVLTFNLWHYQVDFLSARSTTHMIALYKTSSASTSNSRSLAARNKVLLETKLLSSKILFLLMPLV